MRKKLRVLVGVDFSDASNRALRTAASLIRRVGGSATIAHVRPISDRRAAVNEDRGDLVRLPSNELRQGLAAHYRQRLESARRRIPGSRTQLLAGRPARALARAAARGYDLIIVGSHGRGAIGRTLLGSTAQEVLHRARIPVLIIESKASSRR